MDFIFGTTEVHGIMVCHMLNKHMIERVKYMGDKDLVQVHDGNFKNNKEDWVRLGRSSSLC